MADMVHCMIVTPFRAANVNRKQEMYCDVLGLISVNQAIKKAALH